MKIFITFYYKLYQMRNVFERKLSKLNEIELFLGLYEKLKRNFNYFFENI